MTPKAEKSVKEANSQSYKHKQWLQRLSKSNDFLHEHTSIKEENPFWLSERKR